MTKAFKPEGYNSVSPYLVVAGAVEMAALLEKIFGARALRRYDKDDGTIMHMEMMVYDSVVMIADSSEQYPPNKSLLHVYVPDVDKVYRTAISEGCHPMEEPKTRDGDPDKRGSFVDFSGNVWSIGTQQ